MVVLCAPTTTNRESHNLHNHKEHPNHRNHKRRTHNHKTHDLTRFGLNAYVLGAINGEIITFKEDYNLLATSLNAKEMQPYFSRSLCDCFQTLETKTALNTQICGAADFRPNPSVGRPAGRPTTCFLFRSTGTVDPENPRDGLITVSPSRSTGRSTAAWPVHIVHVGRPDRSTEPCQILLLLLFSAVSSIVSCRRLPRRSLDGPGQLPQ